VEITKLCKLAGGIKAKGHKTKGPKMRHCLLKTMGTTISMMNLHLFFLPEIYTGVLFYKFFLSYLDNQLSGASWQNASMCGYFIGCHGRGVPLGCFLGGSG
jgi:hypothetical protein